MKDEATATPYVVPQTLPLPDMGAVLAFDFGEKRIGIALGDLKLKIAHPLAKVEGDSNDKKFAGVAEFINEYRPALLVVGIAIYDDGAPHETGRLARKFAQRLQGRFNIRTVLVDERLSSAAAAEALAQSGVRGQRQKLWLDQVAAQQILQQFFDDPKIVT